MIGTMYKTKNKTNKANEVLLNYNADSSILL